ncbi:MAG TPA: dTMP kinase [Chloroflexota bacterium]|nr:dTMP kinase [Chloroflexota bacterium]
MSLFITFEGTDGSGKSTQARLLADALRRRGHRVVETREPGGTDLGEGIRELILGPAAPDATPLAMTLLYSASRAQLVDAVIRPALDAGAIVIADRYIDSTLAYQGHGLGLDRGLLRAINDIATGGLMPSITVVVDIEPEVAMSRTERRGGPNRFDAESATFHRRVRDGYLALAETEPQRWIVVNGSGSPAEVHAEIVRQLEPRLPTLEEAS